MQRFSLWITHGQKAALVELSKRNGTNHSDVVRQAIEFLAEKQGVSTADPTVPDPRQLDHGL